jgi:hypothetical protein
MFTRSLSNSAGALATVTAPRVTALIAGVMPSCGEYIQ